jgi:hypothetical protein
MTCPIEPVDEVLIDLDVLWLYWIRIYIYIYTTSEKPVNDQSYGVLDRYGITILNK